ncbi:unnamed protein product, partial [marine sediment metagenome]
YPFPEPSINANFVYTIDEVNSEIDFNDISTFNVKPIDDWNWLINGISESTDQNFIYTTTAYEDINACLIIDNNDDTLTDTTCQSFNSGSLVGRITINTFDENSLNPLYNVNINFNGTDYNASNTMDINNPLSNSSSSQYTFTLTKTDYATRYYVVDLNKFSDLDINFALLPTALSTTVPFKVYQTDETTLFTNTYIELYLPDINNWVVGRTKTSVLGETSFEIHLEDQNYYANVNNGEFVYQPVALTILYPKNEETLLEIVEDWQIEI